MGSAQVFFPRSRPTAGDNRIAYQFLKTAFSVRETDGSQSSQMIFLLFFFSAYWKGEIALGPIILHLMSWIMKMYNFKNSSNSKHYKFCLEYNNRFLWLEFQWLFEFFIIKNNEYTSVNSSDYRPQCRSWKAFVFSVFLCPFGLYILFYIILTLVKFHPISVMRFEWKN